MRIYISGPISGTDDYKERFADAARKLKAAGFEYYNPAAIEDALPGGEWSQYMALDLQAILWCDGILLLPGWEDSAGAVSEHNNAVRLGFLEFTLDDFPEALTHD